jgi:hypothetical protein
MHRAVSSSIIHPRLVIVPKMAEKEGIHAMAPSTQNTSADKQQPPTQSSWLPPIAELSALATLLGATIYVVGLITLYGPIFREYTQDSSLALHAASIVPNTVVAGLGINSVFRGSIFMTLAVIASPACLIVLIRVVERLHHRFSGHKLIVGLIRGAFVLVLLLWFAAGLYGLYGIITQPVFAAGGGSDGTWVSLPELVQSFALIAVVIVSTRLGNNVFEIPQEGLIRVVSWVRLWRYSFVIFIILALSSLVEVSSYEPPLDPVEISGPNKVEGRLLGHREGYWYLFDREGTLMVISDKEVKSVEVFGGPH